MRTSPSDAMPTPAAMLDIDTAAFATVVRRLALAAAGTVAAMFALFVATGIGQDPLQYVHTVADYQAILLKNPPLLRTAIGLDNLFIVLYSAMFLTLGPWLWDRSIARSLLLTALALLGLTGLLDLLENMHFLTLIAAAEAGIAPRPRQIELQVLESLVKFHVSYFGLFLLGMAWPRRTALERGLGFALRWVQLPVGLLIYLTPAAVAVVLVLVRFSFFLCALLAIAQIARPSAAGSGGPA